MTLLEEYHSTKTIIIDLIGDDFVAPTCDIGSGASRFWIKYDNCFDDIFIIQILVKNGHEYHQHHSATFSLDKYGKIITIWKALQFDEYRVVITGLDKE